MFSPVVGGVYSISIQIQLAILNAPLKEARTDCMEPY